MRRSGPEHDLRHPPVASRELRLWAHRGASAECAENTLEAFERALERGANALELDVHLTVDRQVVVMHDATGQRVANHPDRVSRTSLRKLRAWEVGGTLATLDDVLALRPAVHLSVDIKSRQLATVATVLDVIRRHDAERRVTVASFHTTALLEVRRLGYRGPTALGQTEVLGLALLPELAHRLRPLRGAAAQVPVRHGPLVFGSRRFIAKCHRLGLRVDFWTIDDPAEAERLLELGADGIMTNDPARLLPLFQDRWLR